MHVKSHTWILNDDWREKKLKNENEKVKVKFIERESLKGNLET